MNGAATSDDHDVMQAGYKPQLHRTIGSFASFAIPYSFMSILMGVYANYSYVLNKAGPFGFWTWPIVAIGQLLVALVFAEMASRFPLTGSLYNWNSRMSNSTIGWFVGWTLAFAYAISGPGVILILFPPLQTLLGIQFSPATISIIGVSVILLQLLINIYGVQLAAYINRLAVICEMIALIGFGSVLAFILLLKGSPHPQLLTAVPSAGTSYLVPFLMCTLLAAFTIFGFESASDLSEETVRVKHIAPRSIIYAVIASAVLGFLFIVVLTLAIPNLGAITAAADPISTIFSYYLGTIPTKIFIVSVLIAIFATALLIITLASRLLFAIARDKHFIASSFFEKVSARRVPANAAVVIAIVEILAFVFLSGLAALYAAPVVLLLLAYLVTVINFARNPDALPPSTTFSLGKWRKPIAWAAIIWLIAEILILTVPKEFNLAAFIAIGIIAIGVLQYLLQHALNIRPEKSAS